MCRLSADLASIARGCFSSILFNSESKSLNEGTILFTIAEMYYNLMNKIEKVQKLIAYLLLVLI